MLLHTTAQCYHFERLVLILGQHSQYFLNSIIYLKYVGRRTTYFYYFWPQKGTTRNTSMWLLEYTTFLILKFKKKNRDVVQVGNNGASHINNESYTQNIKNPRKINDFFFNFKSSTFHCYISAPGNHSEIFQNFFKIPLKFSKSLSDFLPTCGVHSMVQ